MYPGLRLTSFIRWIYKSATSTYGSMRELLKTGIFVVLLKSNEAEECCFEDWSSWQQSSLTCGQVCEYRTRKLIESFWAVASVWVAGINCNKDHSSCPSHEFKSRLCYDIECRKFYLNIVRSCLNFFVPNFLNHLISKFISDIDWLERLVNMSSHLRNRNSIKRKIMRERFAGWTYYSNRWRLWMCRRISKWVSRRTRLFHAILW